ncbi:GntR family transcriptional regulator [Micrococcus endophyticus]|uniref:GntR family transcriptional regulator n=1 Tax=Micrococcus endophyticus TaxID=455343 RepID=UPI0002E7E8D3
MPEGPAPLTEISHAPSLRESVTDTLRTAVIVGDLVEGELYSAPTLAAQLGVSATPVREAMMDLAREGLVTVAKNKGFRVTAMTPADLEQHTQVRQLLEAPAMRAVAGHIPEEDFPELLALAAEIEDAATRGDLRAYLSGDRRFHAMLIARTQNARLADLATSLRGQTRLKALRALAESGQLVHSAREHHRLLDLLRDGDGEGAYELTLRHIGHASRLWATGSEDGSQPPAPAVDLFPRSERSGP